MLLLQDPSAVNTGTDPVVQITPLFAGVGGIILLGVLLPFAVSLILDGLVMLATKHRVAGIVVAVVLSLLIWAVGSVMMSIAATSPYASTAAPGFQQDLGFLLPFASVFAAVAFLIRQGKRLMTRR